MSEFSRIFDAVGLPGSEQVLTANAPECAALAARFALAFQRHGDHSAACQQPFKLRFRQVEMDCGLR